MPFAISRGLSFVGPFLTEIAARFQVLELAHKMKANPQDYFDALQNETLLM